MHRLGSRVASRRAAAGLTRRELAARAGLTTRYIELIETGHRTNLTMATLGRIAEALETRPGDLLSDDPDPVEDKALVR